MSNQALFDKRSVFQVLGGLMKCPQYIDEYNITIDDFDSDLFYRLVFSAINNLYKQGVHVIDSFAIDSLLSHYETQYQLFKGQNGVEYCSEACRMCEIENFDYYVRRLKKFSFLRYLEFEGYDVKKIYDWTITDPEKQERETAKFDNTDITEMVDYIESTLILNSRLGYCSDSKDQGQMIGSGLKQLKESLKESPEFGLPLQSPLLTTATRGMRLRKIFIRSSATGGGKTRTALADFCNISIPWYYDLKQNKWIHTGISEPALFISTELEVDEVQTIVLAYVSGVTEEHILNGKYEPGEEERIDAAISYVESSPFFIEFMPNFDMTTIESIVKKYHINDNVNYVCFDYLHMSTRLIAELATESRGLKGMREDQVMFLFVDKLKNLCNSLGIFILTMTQLNGTYKDSPIKDETMLRSAKSIADRIDMGEISLPPTEADLKAVRGIISKRVGMPEPNLVRHVYKLRRGKLSKIRIWQHADLGMARTEDLFVTNYDYKLISVNATQIEMMDEAIEKESVESSSVIPIEQDLDKSAPPEEQPLSISFTW